MTHLRELGLRLGLVAAGSGVVFLAVASDDLSIRLVAVAMALVFLGPLVLLLLTDLGVRLGSERAGHRDPAGPPAIGEWVIAVVFDSAFVFMVYAGLVAAPADSGELLTAGLICAAVGLFLTAQLVRRWWRARRHRPPR